MGAIAFAALAVCRLLSHQPPQIETDRQAGKQSFAVRYGVRRTRQSVYVLFMRRLSTTVCVVLHSLIWKHSTNRSSSLANWVFETQVLKDREQVRNFLFKLIIYTQDALRRLSTSCGYFTRLRAQ